MDNNCYKSNNHIISFNKNDNINICDLTKNCVSINLNVRDKEINDEKIIIPKKKVKLYNNNNNFNFDILILILIIILLLTLNYKN